MQWSGRAALTVSLLHGLILSEKGRLRGMDSRLGPPLVTSLRLVTTCMHSAWELHLARFPPRDQHNTLLNSVVTLKRAVELLQSVAAASEVPHREP